MTDARPQATKFSNTPAPGASGGHSPETANVGGVVLFAVGLVVLLVLSHVVLIGLYFLLRAEQNAKAPAPPPFVSERESEVPPPPRLEINSPEGLRRLRLAEEVALESPAWFDAKTGRGHVPIERAMELVVEGRRVVTDAKSRRRRDDAAGGGTAMNIQMSRGRLWSLSLLRERLGEGLAFLQWQMTNDYGLMTNAAYENMKHLSLVNSHLSFASEKKMKTRTLAPALSLRRERGGRLLIALCLCLTILSHASADTAPDPLRDVDLRQNLGGHIPLDAAFTDDTGRRVTMRDYFGGKHPVVLVMAYYDCPMLCTLVLNSLAESLQQVPFDAGRDFEIVVVSIDPHETPVLAARKKRTYVSLYGRLNTAAGWHLLTGDERNIRAVADAVGFKYVYDTVSHQYAHPAGIMMLTPDGTISRYFYGTAYAPLDMKLGLLDAGKGTIGSPVQEVLLRCFQYDPMTGRYGFAVMTALRVCAVVTMAGLVVLVWVMSRRAKSRRAGTKGGVVSVPGSDVL